jgi:hypothetical protein
MRSTPPPPPEPELLAVAKGGEAGESFIHRAAEAGGIASGLAPLAVGAAAVLASELGRAVVSEEDLEVELTPSRRSPSLQPSVPSVEQLGGVIDLEEGPTQSIELAPTSPIKHEVPLADDEVQLPRAQSPGQFAATLRAAPLTETPAESGPAPLTAAVQAPSPSTDTPTGSLPGAPATPAPTEASAPPAADRTPMNPPSIDTGMRRPEALDFSSAFDDAPGADIVARSTQRGEVVTFVPAAASASALSSFGDLLDLSLSLGS